jgi:hypothetical protein
VAKQYIPGVSGLLTEPNPVDAPSNTLSEAENIIVEQGGKVQARHGLNVTEIESNALMYNDINAISDVSIGGNIGGAYFKPSRSIDYAPFNILDMETASGQQRYKTGTVTNLTKTYDFRVPYDSYLNENDPTDTTATDYESALLTDDSSADFSSRYVELFTALNNIADNNFASGTWIYNGTNDTKTILLTFFINRVSGSSRFTLQIGQVWANSVPNAYNNRLQIVFDFDTSTVLSVSTVGSAPPASPEHVDSKIVPYGNASTFTAGNRDWYKVSVRFKVTPQTAVGYADYERYAKISARVLYRTGSYSNALRALSPDGGMSYTSYVAGTNSTRLNVTSLSSFATSSGSPRLFVGDTVSFTTGNEPTGLTAGTLYRISVIDLINNYIEIQHTGITTSGSLTNKPFSTGTSYSLAYARMSVDYNQYYGEYLKKAVQNAHLNSTISTITTGYPTLLAVSISKVYPESYIKFVKITESLPATLPTGLELNQPYKVLAITTGGRQLDVTTSGAGTFSNVCVSAVAVPAYVACDTTLTDTQYARTIGETNPWYAYSSQYTLDVSAFKFIKYKDSGNNAKTLMFVNQRAISYAANQTGIFKVTRTDRYGDPLADAYLGQPNINRYYLVDSSGNLGKYETLPYTTVNNAFETKESIYLQTESGIAEANVDDIAEDKFEKFFNVKWPAYPDISYKLKTSDIVGNWLRAGTKCAVRMAFYRETGYTDKPGVIYESEPSVPVVVTSLFKNTIPEFYLDFRTLLTSSLDYQVYNEFVKAAAGRKFGIRLYRTVTVDIDENIPTEYFQCYADLPFDNFMGSTIYDTDRVGTTDAYFVLRDSRPAYKTSATTIVQNNKKIPLELNVGDIVHVAYDDTQGSSTYNSVAVDLPIRYPFTGTVSTVNNNISVTDNPFVVGDVVYFDATSLPSPLTTKTPYYVTTVNALNIQISTSPNGSNVVLTTTGTGLQIFSPKYTTDSGWPSITTPTVNYPRVPSKYNTTDSTILKEDFKPARLRVIAKKPYRQDSSTTITDSGVNTTTVQFYGYKFQTIDGIFNTRALVDWPLTLSTLYIAPNTILTSTEFAKLYATNDGQIPSYANKVLIMRSFIASLEINDEGIISLPQLYTNINSDGESNANIIAPRSANSIKYKDFQVYHGIKKSLTTSLFVTKQPRTEQVYFHHLNNTAAAWVGGQPVQNQFFLPSQNSSLPIVGSSTISQTVNGGRLFMDAPFCGTKDVEITKFNSSGTTSGSAPANRLEVSSGSIINPILTLVDGTSSDTNNQNLLNTYRFIATVYEQGSIALKLTAPNTTRTITIKTYPIYNRRGYYNKYNSDGVLDDRELEFDFSLNEANGIQLSNYQELAMRQFANSGKPQVTLNATSPASGKDSNLLDTMGNGVFNVPGSKDGQYQPDGVVKGFTTSEATTPRGFVWDATNGKVVIRTDGTAGASTNKFDLKKFESPGYLLIQYNKSVDGTQSLNDWNSKGSVIFSYTNITQRSNGIFDIIGAKPANIIPLTSLINATTLHTDIIINLFFLKATAVDNIPLYPYSDAPLLRKSSVTLSKTGSNFVAILNEYCPSPQILNGQPFTTSEDSNSPAQPFFTFHPHQNRSSIPIAVFSSTGNHRFLGALAGYAKSEAELVDEYAYQIVESFNKEFRKQKIDATMLKGPNVGEIIIDYPAGETIEIRNMYGSHEFYPTINGVDTLSTNTPGYYIKLAERVNNEYEEKNQIQWSRRRIPEITTRTLYKNIGENNSSIIGIAANTDDLYVFKEDGVFRCTDSGDLNGFDLPVVSEFTFSTNLICQASGSIQEINDEIIFLSQYGFMSIVNGGVQNISGAIERDILTLLSVSPKNRIRSFVNESKNLYYCTFINESDPTLNVKSGTYIFNTKTRQWSFMDEEVLAGIEDYSNRNVVAYRQRPVKAVLQNRVMTDDGSKPIFDFTSSQVMSNNMVQRATETTPLDLFYTTREQYTNNVRNNALDQYDYISQKRYEGTNELWIKKTGTNEFCLKTEFIPRNTIFRNKFRTSIEHALVSSYDSVPALGSTVSVVDSFVTLFANRTVYLRRMNSSAEMYQIRIKSNGFDNCNMLAYYEFVDTPPSWFTAMANGYFNTNGTATYEIIVGIPVKIAFNPESGNSPDTNKLFQEYMVHTETTNKGALMSFKTDSRSAFTTDRRFVYDPAATTRNVFRTYIPTTAARGRYLIRQIKHDVPLENLIITGQTIVMRDSGSTRVQKDKDES